MTAATERALYEAWKTSGASEKVLLALFEAAIVESGAKNLASRAVPQSLKFPHEGVARGDHDSVGVLQQRASWGSVESRMNVRESAIRFINTAKRKERSGQTAGQLAQAVQVSAFPLRYDTAKARASVLIAKQRSGDTGRTTTPVGSPLVPDSVENAFSTLTSRRTWVRVGMGLVGMLLLFYGIMKMTGDNQLSPMTKRVAKAVVLRKVGK